MPAYDAFISYSHAKDKPIAAALQSVVQRLGKPWYRRRALRVFRDDTSLSATPHLWPSIEQALAQSHFLILLASPEAAASPWVGKEIEYWLAHKSPETLLIALTGGTLAWDYAKGDFDWSAGIPLPAILERKFAAEPRWVDLTAYRDGANPRDARFMDLGADFAAAIRGIPKEDLLSQEVREQRRALTLAWSAAGSLLVLAALAVWQWRVASEQRERAVTALSAARQTAETLVFDLARDLRNRPGMPIELVSDILERVQTLQRQLGGSASTAELFRLEAVSLYDLSESYRRQGNRVAALEAVRRAIAILEALAKQHPDQRLVQRNLAIGLNQLGDLLREEQKWAEVLALYRRALAIVEALSAGDRDNTTLQRDLWITNNKIAEVQTINAAYEDALASYRKGLDVIQSLIAKHPDNIGLLADLAFSYGRIGITQNAMRRYAEALKSHQQALSLREQVAATRPNDTSVQHDVFVSQNRVAEVLAALGQRAEAISAFRKAIAVAERLAAGDPRNAQWQGDLIGVYDHLGRLLIESGAAPHGRAAYQQALAARERRAAIAPGNLQWQSDLASGFMTLGGVLLAGGKQEDLPAALASYRQALAIRKRVMDAEPGNVPFQREYVLALSLAADILYRLGRKEESHRDWRAAFAIVERYAAAEPDNAVLQMDLAIGFLRLAYYLDEDPEAYRQKARAIVERLEAQGKITPGQKAFIASLERLLADKPK